MQDLVNSLSESGKDAVEKLMDSLSQAVILYQLCWEALGWKGFKYHVFERLARMFPAPCQELYPLQITEAGGVKVLLFRRPESDKFYSNQWHNPGTAHRSTDSLWSGSLSNKKAMETVPKDVLREAKQKITWNLNARLTALFRVLVGNEIGLSEQKALVTLERITAVDFYPLEMTARGPESAVLNVWIMRPDEVDKIQLKENVGWFDVTKIPQMARKNVFLEHQVNRFATMLYGLQELSEVTVSIPEIERF